MLYLTGPLCSSTLVPSVIKPGQYGSYEFEVATNSIGECMTSMSTAVSPPLFDSFVSPLLFLLAAFLLPILLRCFYSNCKDQTPRPSACPLDDTFGGKPLSSPFLSSPHSNSLTPSAGPSTKRRINSLDAFRGLSLVLMIFVNYGGGGYYFFNHSTWNGLTVADLLFPWFVWIMGVTVGVTFKPPSSISSRTSKFFNVLQRSVKLFCLGLLLNSTGTDGDLANLRIPGVLQYFAVSYLYLNILALLIDSPSASRPRLFLGYGLGGLALLFMYCVLTYAVPVPDCPMGYLGAGGTFDGAEHPLCTGGSHRYIDEKILTSSHYYSDPTCKGVYGCLPYDPEGIVGAFNAAFLSFLGFATGKIVRAIPTNPTGEDQSIFLRYNAILGVLLMTVGAVLCNFSENNGIVPVNKNLWSPSFIFICGGFANILFGLFYVLLDMRRSSASIPQNSKFTDPSFLASDDSPSTPLWDGWPLRSVGKNSITLYMGHEILDGAVPFAMFFTEKGRDEHWGVVGSNVIGVACWCAIALYMDHKKIYVTV